MSGRIEGPAMLLQGLDAVGVTLEHADEIRRFEQRYLASQPWLD